MSTEAQTLRSPLTRRTPRAPAAEPSSGPAASRLPAVAAPPVTLFMRAGCHRGAVHKLEPGPYRLGRSLDADIVLGDEGIEDFHCLVVVDQSSVSIEPLSAPVRTDRGTLEPGEFDCIELPGTLSLGACTMQFRRPRQIRRSRPLRLAALLVMMGGAASAAAYAMGSAMQPGGIGPAGTERQPPDAERAEAAEGTSHPQRIQAAIDDSAPRQALENRLREVGLGDRLAIGGANGLLRVAGSLPAGDLARWQEVHRWFDREFGGAAVIVSEVDAAPEVRRPDVALQAVYATDPPFIVAGGKSFPVGARLSNRWTVEAISGDAVRLRDRDGTVVTLDLSGQTPQPAPQPAPQPTGEAPR